MVYNMFVQEKMELMARRSQRVYVESGDVKPSTMFWAQTLVPNSPRFQMIWNVAKHDHGLCFFHEFPVLMIDKVLNVLLNATPVDPSDPFPKAVIACDSRRLAIKLGAFLGNILDPTGTYDPTSIEFGTTNLQRVVVVTGESPAGQKNLLAEFESTLRRPEVQCLIYTQTGNVGLDCQKSPDILALVVGNNGSTLNAEEALQIVLRVRHTRKVPHGSHVCVFDKCVHDYEMYTKGHSTDFACKPVTIGEVPAFSANRWSSGTALNVPQGMATANIDSSQFYVMRLH